MSERNDYKIGAVFAIVGAVFLFVGTFLHPLSADPNDPSAAFTEYAADRPWVVSHLMQLAGVLLMVFALVLLSRLMANGRGAGWAYLGAISAGAGLALAGALQAVDGVALKMMVNSWAAASGADKDILFQATFAVRQIEVGLASIFSLLMGIAVTVYGIAFILDNDFPNWLGWMAMVGGVPTAVAGIFMAYTGFSAEAMIINMIASPFLLAWVIAVGWRMWRLGAKSRTMSH